MPELHEILAERVAGVKAKALRELEGRNPGRVAYRIVFADEFVSQSDLAAVRGFVSGS